MQAAVGSSEGQLHQQLVEAALSLSLESPLAHARLAAEAQGSLEPCEGKSSEASEAGDDGAGASAALKAVGEFLKGSLEVGGISEVDATSLADLHAFSSASRASASEVALEKEEGVEASRRSKARKPVTRQQMQRRFKDLRSVLRNELKLPCLSMCGSSPGLFAAALNDASGLPGFSEVGVHPLQHVATLQLHDTARRATASRVRRKKAGKVNGSEVSSNPIAEVLGSVWISAAQQWYLLLQSLLQCQQFPCPHKDVAADRETLLGYAAALVLHILQQRNRCWQAAAAFQDLVDAARVSLVSPSAAVHVSAASDLVAAAEALHEVLLQARALLPSPHEAAVQNEALAAAVAPCAKAETLEFGTGSSVETLADAGTASLPSCSSTSAGTPDETALLQQNIRQIRSAHSTLSSALRALAKLEQLLHATSEARRLCAARTRGAEQGSATTPTVPADAAKATAMSRHQIESAAVDRLRRSALAALAVESDSGMQRHSRIDDLLQLSPTLEEEDKAQQQPGYAALPVPDLESLFSFKTCIAALNDFVEAAPSCMQSPLLLQKSDGSEIRKSEAAMAVLRMLQRSAGVVLAVFDGLEGTVRLGLSLLQLIEVLLQFGWGCLSNEEEENAAMDAGRSEKQKEEWVAGTGLGEGEGARDASEQIEEEWQFDGLKDEKSDPQQKLPEKPKSQEEDKAMEVSMHFEGDAEAPPPPPAQQEDQQRQSGEEAQQLEDVAGNVDLKEGGQIESKRWAGEDGDRDEDDTSTGKEATQKQEEDIQTEGGLRDGNIELEGTKDEAAGEPAGGSKDSQRLEGDPQASDGGKEEDDGGNVEDPAAEEEAQQQSQEAYKKKLQKGENVVDADGGEEAEEEAPDGDTSAEAQEADDGGGGTDVTGDAQQQKGHLEGDGAASGSSSDDFQVEEELPLDGEAGEEENDGLEEAADAEAEEQNAATGAAAGEQEVKGKAGEGDATPTADQGCAVAGEDAAVDEAEQAEQLEGDMEEDEQQRPPAEEAEDAAFQSAESAVAEASAEPAQKEESEALEQDEGEANDSEEALQAASIQDGYPAGSSPLSTPEMIPSQRGEAERERRLDTSLPRASLRPLLPPLPLPLRSLALCDRLSAPCVLSAAVECATHTHSDFVGGGGKGKGAAAISARLVQRDAMEGDADKDANSGEAFAEEGEQHGANTAAATTREKGRSLSRSALGKRQESASSPSGDQGPSPSLLPDNPLGDDDDGAVERWLQRVRLLQPQDAEAEEADALSCHPEAEGAAPPDLTNGEESEDAHALQSGQLCQRDDAGGNQEAFAEASDDAAPLKPNKMAKLADAEAREEHDNAEDAQGNANKDAETEEVILSTSTRVDELKASSEKQQPKEPLAQSAEHEGPMDADSSQAVNLDSPSDDACEQLYDDLSAEPGAEGEPTVQQPTKQLATEAAASTEERDTDEVEEERMAAMEADYQERVSLDDVGKEGLSPEHAAALWHLLEGRTAASAAALSESLRLVLQPTANGAWEGGYRTGIDCSRSMQQLNAAASALEAVVLLSSAFNHLQIGTVSVCTFGGPKPEVCIHPTSQVSAGDGQRLLQRCSFREESHKSHEVAISDLLQLAIHELEQDGSLGGNGNNSSMILILSDGRFNKEQTRPWVNAAIARGCIPLLLILDPQQREERMDGASDQGAPVGESQQTAAAPQRPPSPHSSSIFDLKQVQQQPGGAIEVTPYLQDFPFPYYAVVTETQQLPTVLANVIRQWVEATASDW
ncbi:Midasin, related protein [Cyclospora cayetanensis]|uniref:Midasin, related protein n=1 Tax=Cyclospora cayetanensis TaxID=88456 RepID=A0A1D3CT12_9EIME|nr:Midasin, related protein [Cyclospora cayetanensis]